MIKKIAILVVTTLLLGGCTLPNIFKTEEAAKDEKKMMATDSPVPTMSPDTRLDSIPSPTSANDMDSLEVDINNTIILEEDFSDLD